MKNRKTQNLYQEVNYDRNTGEVVTYHTVTRVRNEPEYAKFYVGSAGNQWIAEISILFELVRRMTYSNCEAGGNLVYLTSSSRKAIAESCGLTEKRIRNAMSALLDAGMVRRLERGVYQVNPYIFGKGPWDGVARLREGWAVKRDAERG